VCSTLRSVPAVGGKVGSVGVGRPSTLKSRGGGEEVTRRKARLSWGDNQSRPKGRSGGRDRSKGKSD